MNRESVYAEGIWKYAYDPGGYASWRICGRGDGGFLPGTPLSSESGWNASGGTQIFEGGTLAYIPKAGSGSEGALRRMVQADEYPHGIPERGKTWGYLEGERRTLSGSFQTCEKRAGAAGRAGKFAWGCRYPDAAWIPGGLSGGTCPVGKGHVLGDTEQEKAVPLPGDIRRNSDCGAAGVRRNYGC